MLHKFYLAIVKAIKAGRLREPFRSADVRKACPGFAPATYTTFLAKHALGNPGNYSVFFERVEKGLYVCIRPFLYGLDAD